MPAEVQDAPNGLQQLRAMLTGDLRAPIGHALGFRLVEAERGRVVFEGAPDLDGDSSVRSGKGLR